MQMTGPSSWIRVLAPHDRLLGMFGTESSRIMNPSLLFQAHIVHGPDECPDILNYDYFQSHCGER